MPTSQPAPLPYAATGALPAWAPRFLMTAGVAVMAIVVAICLPFWLTDLGSEILAVATPALQWIPFLAILIVHAILRPGVRFWRWSAIGVRPLGQTLGAAGIALAVFTIVPLATIVATASLGLVDYSVVEGAGTAALLVLPFSIVWMLFAFGEEAGWRGYIQTTLAPLGFWGSTLIIGGFWAAWHLPVALTYSLDGTMPMRVVVTTTVNLLFAAVAISAVRYLGGSVWPAVFAHAVMNTMGQFAYSNLITPLADLDTPTYWAFHGVSWTIWAAVAIAVGKLVRRRAAR
ncbi:CPBP family intramembrane glutamic endopeptidase [Microbacterium suaedae]|uniref:CPBP family intramembrane glutamic endopeptidase n=1 Tax=Microbacterium suaedae TaxID=2067813 RepID=UPI000DA1F8E6|nr:CPBP family intramembrane glutamic endopeptidase [Microbacterium suaedae]